MVLIMCSVKCTDLLNPMTSKRSSAATSIKELSCSGLNIADIFLQLMDTQHNVGILRSTLFANYIVCVGTKTNLFVGVQVSL